MIETIGSLVQETNAHLRWLTATALHVLGALAGSALLGLVLAGVGLSLPRPPLTGVMVMGLTGLVALLYALGDTGVMRVPRPTLMPAVPVTWWRRWRPYRAPLLYGAALGLGITTRIPFGAFYVLCILSFLRGSVVYGMALMATYGLSRALTVSAGSWIVGSHGMPTERLLAQPFCRVQHVHRLVTFGLIAVSSVLLSASLASVS